MVLSFNNTIYYSFPFQTVNIDLRLTANSDSKNFFTVKIINSFLMFIDLYLMYLNQPLS